MNRILLGLAALASLALQPAPVEAQEATRGRQVAVEGGAYTDLTVAEYLVAAADTDFAVVNVHVPFAGDLPATDASVPFDQIPALVAALPADKGAPVLLYCRSGSMSERAATELAKLGYTNVNNLVGGFNAWQAAGLGLATQ